MTTKATTQRRNLRKKAMAIAVVVIMAASGSVMATQAEARPKYGCATTGSWKATANGKAKTCTDGEKAAARKYYKGEPKRRANPDLSRSNSKSNDTLYRQMQTTRR